MVASEIIARLIGAFYLFGGVLVVRTIGLDDVLDRALAALKAGRPGVNRGLKPVMVGLIGVLTGTGGAALALLSALAVPLFLACLIVQALWFAASPRLLTGDDLPSDTGRNQSRNAMVIYAAATAFAIWLWHDGRLAPWDNWVGFVVLAIGVVLSSRLISQLRANGAEHRRDIEPLVNSSLLPGAPAKILLDLRIGDTPLHNAVSREDVDHHAILSGDLAQPVDRWRADYRRWFNAKLDEEDYPLVVGRIRHNGEAIAARLRELAGPDNVEGPFYDDEFAEAEAQLANMDPSASR